MTDQIDKILAPNNHKNMIRLWSIIKVVMSSKERKYWDNIRGLPKMAKVVLYAAIMFVQTMGV